MSASATKRGGNLQPVVDLMVAAGTFNPTPRRKLHCGRSWCRRARNVLSHSGGS
jgi:hypothetical protein